MTYVHKLAFVWIEVNCEGANCLAKAVTGLLTYLYLKVDGLVSNALSAHISPVFIQPALECIDRWRHHNVLR